MRASRSTSCADGASGGRGGRRSTPSSPSRRTTERHVRVAQADRLDRQRAAPSLPASSARSRGSRTMSGARLRLAASAAVSTMSRSARPTRAGARPAGRSPCGASRRDRRRSGTGGAPRRSARAAARRTCPSPPHSCIARSTTPADGLGDENLGDTRLVPCRLACVEHLGAAADQRPARVEVDHAVRDQGLGDALLVEAPTEELALGRSSRGRHRVRAARGRATACSGSGRAGASRTCASRNPSPSSPSTASSATRQSSNTSLRARRRTSCRSVPISRSTRIPGLASVTMNIDAPRSPTQACVGPGHGRSRTRRPAHRSRSACGR